MPSSSMPHPVGLTHRRRPHPFGPTQAALLSSNRRAASRSASSNGPTLLVRHRTVGISVAVRGGCGCCWALTTVTALPRTHTPIIAAPRTWGEGACLVSIGYQWPLVRNDRCPKLQRLEQGEVNQREAQERGSRYLSSLPARVWRVQSRGWLSATLGRGPVARLTSTPAISHVTDRCKWLCTCIVSSISPSARPSAADRCPG